MNGQRDKAEHEFFVRHRKEMRILGVTDIDSFDEGGAILQTVDGELTVEGNELKIGALDTESGVVTLSGRINAVYYSSEPEAKKKGFMSRLFK